MAVHDRPHRLRAADRTVSGRELSARGSRNPAHHDAAALLLHAFAAGPWAWCKWYVPKVTCEIIHQCLLTHGHYGYTTNLPFHQRYVDVMGLQIGDGTAQIQKLVIAREKVGRIAVQYAKQP